MAYGIPPRSVPPGSGPAWKDNSLAYVIQFDVSQEKSSDMSWRRRENATAW